MLALLTLFAAENDYSGTPTTWPGTITAIAFMVLIGWIVYLIFKD